MNKENKKISKKFVNRILIRKLIEKIKMEKQPSGEKGKKFISHKEWRESLRPDHLNEERPELQILACLTNPSWEEREEVGSKSHEEIKKITEDPRSENINFFSREGINKNYVFSEINERKKYTEFLGPCLSLTAVGESLDGKEDLSFMTHFNSLLFNNQEGSREFIEELKKKLKELKEKTIEKTCDIIIAGGEINPNLLSCYISAIEAVDCAVREVFSSEKKSPLVIAGPKYDSCDSVYFFSGNEKGKKIRKIYIYRPDETITHNAPFRARDVRKMAINNWEIPSS